MWYFSWILGLGLAAAFSILNAMWYELQAYQREQADRDSRDAAARNPAEPR